jgi:hypothetical protein
MLSVRQVIQNYGSSCESLLSDHSFDSPLSEEEVQFIQYYMHEMEKRFGMGLYELQADGASRIRNVTV